MNFRAGDTVRWVIDKQIYTALDDDNSTQGQVRVKDEETGEVKRVARLNLSPVRENIGVGDTVRYKKGKNEYVVLSIDGLSTEIKLLKTGRVYCAAISALVVISPAENRQNQINLALDGARQVFGPGYTDDRRFPNDSGWRA